MKKILILSDINSAHTQKWALSLAAQGFEIGLFGLNKMNSAWFSEGIPLGNDVPNIKLLYSPGKNGGHSFISKALYPFALPALLKAIRKFKPDVVHAHYASSYGLLGALSGFHPYVISVWGSDVFDFPKISSLHKWILKFNLKKADKICSTSHIMQEEIKKYTGKKISVVPFGIDLNIFKPFRAPNLFEDSCMVVGTVKSLEKKYGIEHLIEAFALLRKRMMGYPIKLLIVGKGRLENKLKAKVKELGIENETVFAGFKPPAEIPIYQNMLNVAVFPSIDDSESFGVSVIEAMACEKPVIVSNVGGLPEVVEDNVTGLVVPPANAEKLAGAMEILVKDEQLRIKLGKAGRERVILLYKWEDNLNSMIRIYDELCATAT